MVGVGRVVNLSHLGVVVKILTRRVRGQLQYYHGTGLWSTDPSCRMVYPSQAMAAETKAMLVANGFGRPGDPLINESEDGDEQ